MKRFPMPASLILTIILTACSAPSNPPSPPAAAQDNPQPAPVSNVIPTPTDDPAILATLFPNMGSKEEMTRMDQQGAVIMEVTPLNLGTPGDTLEFDVVMNTHSVDLGMDLAVLATLLTDTGITLQATLWDAPRGGHHVSGKLVFPAVQDGKSILEGATRLILTVVNVDAPSRTFEWELK